MNCASILKMVSVVFASVAVVACSDKAEPPAPPSLSVPASAPPSAMALKYEGKIVRQPPNNRGKDDGWYLVKDGKRMWITDGSWLEKNGFKANEVIEISAADFAEIPENPMPLE